MSGAFMGSNNNIPGDKFMYDTVKNIVIETLGCEDKELTNKVYERLYNDTDAKGVSWNCDMIDTLIYKLSN